MEKRRSKKQGLPRQNFLIFVDLGAIWGSKLVQNEPWAQTLELILSRTVRVRSGILGEQCGLS